MDHETMRDAEGNEYAVVELGNQIWTVENLRTTKYNDGRPIPYVEEESQWSDLLTPATAAYCWYDNDISNRDQYGALYNWYAVNTGNLAPEGWHVPTDVEWKQLEAFLIDNGHNWDGTKGQNKIAKALAAKTNWGSANSQGSVGRDLSKNNTSGFSALPGGARYVAGFLYKSHFGYWWSATECDRSTAYCRVLDSSEDSLARAHLAKRDGFSVRLVRD